MPSKTSFFNKGIFINNIKRFWLITFSYTFFLSLFMVGYLNYAVERSHYESKPVVIAADIFRQSSDIMNVFLGFFCLIAALAVFSYMHFPKNTALMHSLPLRRETLFVTNYLSGLFLVTFPLLFNFLIMIITKAVLGIGLTYAFQWLGVSIVLTFLLYTFAVFAGMFTGHMAAQVFYYLIFNFLAVFLNIIISHIFNDFLFGFASTTSRFDPWSPLYYVMELFSGFSSDNGNLAVVIGYLIAGILFLISSLMLYRKRNMEVATDIISFKAVKPIFKYSATFCSSALLGSMIVAIFDIYNSLIGYIIAYLIGGFIGYFVSEMLLRKTFRVFSAYKGFVVYSIILALLLCGINFDFFGYETYVPDNSEIEILYLSTYRDSRADLAISPEKYDIAKHRYLFNSTKFNNEPPRKLTHEQISELRRLPGIVDSTEAILKARLIHEYIAQNKDLFTQNRELVLENSHNNNFKEHTLYFKYKLKDGRLIERGYTALVTSNNNSKLDELLRDYLSLPEIREKYESILNKEAKDIYSIKVNYYTKEGGHISKEISDIEDFLRVYKMDIMSLDPIDSLYRYYEKIPSFDLSINYRKMNPYFEFNNNYYPQITYKHVNTIDYLIENEILGNEQLLNEFDPNLVSLPN